MQIENSPLMKSNLPKIILISFGIIPPVPLCCKHKIGGIFFSLNNVFKVKIKNYI